MIEKRKYIEFTEQDDDDDDDGNEKENDDDDAVTIKCMGKTNQIANETKPSIFYV